MVKTSIQLKVRKFRKQGKTKYIIALRNMLTTRIKPVFFKEYGAVYTNVYTEDSRGKVPFRGMEI